jgi:hypothetical protein
MPGTHPKPNAADHLLSLLQRGCMGQAQIERQVDGVGELVLQGEPVQLIDRCRVGQIRVFVHLE